MKVVKKSELIHLISQLYGHELSELCGHELSKYKVPPMSFEITQFYIYVCHGLEIDGNDKLDSRNYLDILKFVANSMELLTSSNINMVKIDYDSKKIWMYLSISDNYEIEYDNDDD